jgi:UDP-perosamine 4-acetyltransferase
LKEKIIIIGGGGHAKVVADIIKKTNIYEIVAVIVRKISDCENKWDCPVYEGDEILRDLRSKGITKAAIGIGGYKNNENRKQVFNKLKELEFYVCNIIDPNAIISSTVKIGEGNVIFPGVILNTDVIIGNNVIVATGSTIDHETVLEDNVLISAGVTIGAYSIVRDGALVALGSKVISGIEIGAKSLVAAGSVVVKNVKANEKVFGVPARSKENI